MPSLIGNRPWQVPSNGDLGKLAFMDVLDSFTSKTIMDTDTTNIAPSLNLDFANSKVLDPRITFTRSTTGSFYDGKTVAKAEENLLIYSQDFTATGWATTTATTTANTTTAPDGTTTADTLTEAASSGSPQVYRIFSSTSGLAYTWSGYVKANGRTKVRFRCQATAVVYDVNYDLTAVTTTNIAGTGTATITDVGSGWYRITATATATASGNGYWQLNLLDASSNLTYTGDGTSGVFLWGAQVEQRSAVTAYTPTTTQAITNYIPTLQTASAGVARFDHNPLTGESLGLLIEESRTNLLTYSDDFSNAAWNYATPNGQVTANAIIAPDGTLTADKLFEATAATGSTVHRRIAFPNQGTSLARSVSIYAKRGERKRLYVFIGNGATGTAAWYDLALGTTGMSTDYPSGGTSDITSVGNGWYRCVLNLSSLGVITVQPHVVTDNATTSDTRVGDGFSGIYIWGAQLEAGAFATSYIPTVASQVTRSADAASMTGSNFSSWYRADEGTIYTESSQYAGFSIAARIAEFNSGATSNRIVMSGVTYGLFEMRTNGTDVASFALGSIYANTPYKLIGAYKTNDFQAALNGTTGTADTSGNVSVGLTTMNIGGGIGGAASLNGTIKKLTYFPKRLSNAELQEITG